MKLLEKCATPYGTIRVMQSPHDKSVAYYQDGTFHSQATRKGVSLCVYIHIMHEIIRQADARNILILGGAGGSLATMLRRLHCRVTVVDINPMAFVLARRYFHLPEQVRCIRRDGVAFVRHATPIYDAVVIDVFGGKNMVPRAFTTPAFFQTVKKILTPNGLLMMNVITANDKDRRSRMIARHAMTAGVDVTLFDWPGHTDRNSLIVGNLPRHVRIPSGHEPQAIKPDYQGLIRLRHLHHRSI